MNEPDDELRRLLQGHDPTTDEHPPARDSHRYRTILETAMTTTDSPTNTDAGHPGTARPAPAARRWRTAALVAAAVALVALTTTVVVGVDAPDALATVNEAAVAMTDITSLKGRLEVSSPERAGTSRIRVDGDDVEIRSSSNYADGHSEASTFTVVDGFAYETIEGRTSRRAFEADAGLAPFGSSSTAVITAATTTGSQVVEAGTERIGDVSATRFDIDLAPTSIDALAALTPNQLAWFELENPDRVESMSVWVADGLVRQIRIDHGDRTTLSRYFDLNRTNRIEAPAGPFVEG